MWKNLFAALKPAEPTGALVKPAATQAAEPVASLYGEYAIDHLVKMLTRMPDIDDTLRQAGIMRHKLRILLTDDEIYQAVETRLDALLATPFRVEPSDGDQGKLIMEILKPVLQDAITSAFKARLFGYSVMEAVYAPRPDGTVGLAFLGEKPMEWFEPKSDGRLIYYPNNGQSSPYGLEVDQMFKFFVTKCRPTYQNPYGEALLSRLYWPWFFRNSGWKFWGKFLERFGSPLLVGKSDSPVKMVSALLAAHSNAVIGVGRDDAVESVGVAAGNAGQAFDLYETAVVRRVQKIVLGQTLTSGTDGGSGNRALGQVHNDVRSDKRDSDIKMVTFTMQRVVDALTTLNGWPHHEVVFADETGLEADRATRDKTLYDQGVRFTTDYYKDNYALRDEDFEVTEHDPLAPPPGASDPDADPKVPGKPGQKAPAAGVRKGAKPVKAGLSLIAFSKSKQLFTKKQQEIEDLADAAIETAGQPIDVEAVRAAVVAAKDPEDLVERLFTLVGDKVSEDEFNDVLEKALYTADVLGYCHAEK
jgi:phage gp29-like protein